MDTVRTMPGKRETLTQCWYEVGPASTTLVQPRTRTGSAHRDFCRPLADGQDERSRIKPCEDCRIHRPYLARLPSGRKYIGAYSPADLWQKGSVSDKSTKICILIVHYIPKHISYGPNLNFHLFQNWRPFSNMAAKFVNFDSSSGLVVSISEYKSKKSFLWVHRLKVVMS